MKISIIGIFILIVSLQGLFFREAYLTMISPLYKLPGGYDSNRSPRDLKPMVTFSSVLGIVIGVCFLIGMISLEKFYGSAIPPNDVRELITLFSLALIASGVVSLLSYKWEVRVAMETPDRFFGKSIPANWYRGLAIGSGTISIIVGILGLLGVIPMRI